LQAGARTAGELPHLPALAVWRLPARAHEPAPELRAGAAAGRLNTRRPSLGEVWIVDKITPRLGADGRAEGFESVLDGGRGNALTLSSVLCQGVQSWRAQIRGPPMVGRPALFTRLAMVRPRALPWTVQS
jgi:hypothetical protein